MIEGSTPDEVRSLVTTDAITVRANKLGTLVTGKLGDLVVDYAFSLPGPVYDVMWNPETGWFAVTIYRGSEAVRWDNRASHTDAGFPRVPDVRGASTPRTILEALDLPADAVGYIEA